MKKPHRGEACLFIFYTYLHFVTELNTTLQKLIQTISNCNNVDQNLYLAPIFVP